MYRLGRLDEAVASYERCLRLSPNHSSALNNLGHHLRELGRFDEALDYTNRVSALDPQDPAHISIAG